jgi:hypothetical protein
MLSLSLDYELTADDLQRHFMIKLTVVTQGTSYAPHDYTTYRGKEELEDGVKYKSVIFYTKRNKATKMSEDTIDIQYCKLVI